MSRRNRERGRRGPTTETLSHKVLLVVLGASLLSTVIHYVDNAIYVHEYPQPDWINEELVYIVWTLFTIIGLAGYLFYRDGRTTAAGLYLLVYSYTGLSSLGHYTYGALDEFTLKMHVTILIDGLTGLAVAICALRLLFARRADAQRPVTTRS